MILARSRSFKCVHKLNNHYGREFLTLCLLTAGDGCFYVGLGGKNTLPKQSSYEPYQCCPTKVARGTKVAKMSPSAAISKPVMFGKSHQASNSKPVPVKAATPVKASAPLRAPAPRVPAKEPVVKMAVKADKAPKRNKGFFGSGKYIWWW